MNWHVYTDGRSPLPDHRVSEWLALAPPWRTPPSSPVLNRQPPPWRPADRKRAECYVLPEGSTPEPGAPTLADRINSALLLRRPLLVAGDAGVGKSSLAYNLAWSLGLGPPLRWEINSRSTLQDGLYRYDAVGHLQAGKDRPVGDFVTLGPLGTALLPTARPRLVLIDELDKGSYDLPNDLLHVFEEGGFRVPELAGMSDATAWPGDRTSDDRAIAIPDGEIRAHHHPVVVITTNGEREFTNAFRRRCVEITLAPSPEEFAGIVRSWLGDTAHLGDVLDGATDENVDVVLQALFLAHQGVDPRLAVASLRRNG